MRFPLITRSAKLRSHLSRASGKLPLFLGEPIRLSVRPHLTVARGKLHSRSGKGTPVSAASFLLGRRMILDAELLDTPPEFRRILLHELFHFVWRRLGNQTRGDYHLLLVAERMVRARGELGWSAEWRKDALDVRDQESKSRRWRQYVCESFCDTAAWYFGTGHSEHTLAPRHRARRKRFFDCLLQMGPLRI
ncbi:MAG: hypothetical protein HY820_24845 [Acidobacteria bacterium]|nr:hypothetical protein [Acidobacteriota bacterium]